MTPMGLALIGVTKRFGAYMAAESVSVEVPAGEVAAVVGPSGCGKTTVLRLIAGLETPDAGEVLLDGRVVSAAGRNVVAPNERGIGFVFQDLALWPHLSVEQHLEFVLQAVRSPAHERRARARDVLALVQIEPLARRYPHELSGGEQQRVALARALVGRPRLLLLDEPLSSLDTELRSEVRTELARLQRATGVTTVLVTHDPEDAAVLGDRRIQMRAGRIVATD